MSYRKLASALAAKAMPAPPSVIVTTTIWVPVSAVGIPTAIAKVISFRLTGVETAGDQRNENYQCKQKNAESLEHLVLLFILTAHSGRCLKKVTLCEDYCSMMESG